MRDSGQPRPRTVLFLHGASEGYGADRQLELLATGLDPARYRPLVVLPERGPLSERLDAAGVELVIAPLAVLRRDLLRGRGAFTTWALLRRNVRELGALARGRQVAIVHSNYSLVLCGQRVARRARAAHVLHVREIYDAASPLWPLLRRRLLRADAVVCVSEAVRRPLGAAPNTVVLYDGLTRPPATGSRAEARQALDLDPDAFVVAAIGRISDWKGQDVFVQALADPQLAERGTVGLVAGAAAAHQRHFEDELAALADRLGLDGRVRLLGFRDDVATILAAADAVAVPSTFPDPLPNVALEAAAAGRAVVATDTGGQREILRDGETGLLVPPREPAALARALRTLADDPAAAERLGAAAQEDVRIRFAPARLLEGVQERYDALLATDRFGPLAWLLPIKSLRVTHQAAPELRTERFERWLRRLGYRTRVLPSPGPLAAPAVAVRALRERPSLVVSSASVHAPTLTAVRLVLGRRVTIVADVIGLFSLEIDRASAPGARPLLRPVWRRFERRFVRVADLVLAVNERHAEIVRERYRRTEVAVLRDSAPTAEVVPTPRAALGIPEDAVAVVFAGSLVYRRLDDLAAAWQLLDDPRLALVVAGGGPDLEHYRALGLRNAVFLGGLPHADTLAVVAACDIAYSDCWTAIGFPAKVFEAMALGVPVITEGTEAATEVVEDGRSALLYRTAGLAAALARLADDPDLRARLGAAAREELLVHHSDEVREQELRALVQGGWQAPPRPARAEPGLVSVVMPLRNEAEHVGAQLEALAAQTYAGAWELVVVDDGSRDGSVAVVEAHRGSLPEVRIVRTTRRGLNGARNLGARSARSELLAFCDADDVVSPGWLAALVAASGEADLVGGTLDLETLNPESVRSWRPGEPLTALPVAHEFLPYVPGGNCAIWTDVARALAWDESFRFGSSDVECGWRAHLAGYRLAFAPDAVIAQRFRSRLAPTLVQHVRYGASVPHLYRRFGSAGMRSPGGSGALRAWRRLARTSPDLLRSPERRGHWLRVAAVSVGRLGGSLRWRAFHP